MVCLHTMHTLWLHLNAYCVFGHHTDYEVLLIVCYIIRHYEYLDAALAFELKWLSF